jgi:hypothetical protein
MEKVRAAPLNDSPLMNLSPEHLRWRDSGAILWEASLLLSQGRESQADARAAESLALLPPELRDLIGGTPRPDADEGTPPRTR